MDIVMPSTLSFGRTVHTKFPSRPIQSTQPTKLQVYVPVHVPIHIPVPRKLVIDAHTKLVLDEHFTMLYENYQNRMICRRIALKCQEDLEQDPDYNNIQKLPPLVKGFMDITISSTRYTRNPYSPTDHIDIDKFRVTDHHGNKARRTYYISGLRYNILTRILRLVYSEETFMVHFNKFGTQQNDSPAGYMEFVTYHPQTNKDTKWRMHIRTISIESHFHKKMLKNVYGKHVHFKHVPNWKNMKLCKHSLQGYHDLCNNKCIQDIVRVCGINDPKEIAMIETNSKETGDANSGKLTNYTSNDEVNNEYKEDGSVIVHTKSNNIHHSPYVLYGYKWASGHVVKLGIRADTRLNHSKGSEGKVRMDKADVLAIAKVYADSRTPGVAYLIYHTDTVSSGFNASFTYATGVMAHEPDFDTSGEQCSRGIHFFFDPIAAANYGYLSPFRTHIIHATHDILTANFFDGNIPEQKSVEELVQDMLAKYPAPPALPALPTTPSASIVQSADDSIIIENTNKRHVAVDPFNPYNNYIIERIKRQRQEISELAEIFTNLDALDLAIPHE